MVVCNFDDPSKWGGHIWYVMDLMVIRLDPSNRLLENHILMFFVSLLETIPCETCREHYQHYFQEKPIETALQSKMDLAKWVYECKSSVNSRLNIKNIAFPAYLDYLSKTFDCDLREKKATRTLYRTPF